MITVPTHKRHYSPFKTLKDHLCFYIWTSNSHCPNPYLVEKSFKGVKMTTAKWTSIQERSRIQRYPAARFNEKGCLPVWGEDALKVQKSSCTNSECVHTVPKTNVTQLT
jgi:hypothetical protein